VLNLAEWVDKAARKAPHDVALIDPHGKISRTFEELATRTTGLAHGLQDVVQAGLGQRVAVLSKNTLEFIELYLAAAASGTIMFPLNWRESEAVTSAALRDLDPVVVFYENGLDVDTVALQKATPDAQWIAWGAGAPPYEDLIAAGLRSSAPLPDPASLLEEPYLAASTGGTTGIKKYAVHSQRSYEGNLFNYLGAERIREDDIFMMLGPFFHVTGYMALAHLVMGRPVVITNFDDEETIRVINQTQATSFFCISTMLPRLVAAAHSQDVQTPSVRLIGYGGSPMGREVIRQAAETFHADLMQIWGMSEFGTGTVLGPAAHRRALDGSDPNLLNSCGSAALVSEIKIVDPSGQLVPRDGKTPGEILHAGPNNMIAYWNNPEETAALMRDGWVHSGDGATWDEDGNVYIVDRIKNMIISGGENIFPAEIEKTISDMPEVSEVCVVGAPHPEWGEVIRAVVVRSEKGEHLTGAGISAHVAEQLGSYRKPRIVDFVTSLPKGETGKVSLVAVRAIPSSEGSA
jgi:acyl-CoA synthetase (AMP-forming)/AMP-acid ligase II